MENNQEPKILFAKTKESAIIPSKKVEDAGYDIYACWEGLDERDRIIKPHTTKLIPTGIACALPTEFYFQVEERGSTGSKGIKRSAGVIDSGYRGEIFIAISNVNDKFVIFGDKETYLQDALKELEVYINTDPDNIPEDVRQNLEDMVKNSIYTEEVYNSLSDEDKELAIKNCLDALKMSEQKEVLTARISNAIFYPENKAIAQLVLHQSFNLPVEEISYDDLKNIPSQRGTGSLGSSNK